MELSERQGDGATLRTHLQRLYANTRKLDPRLEIEWPKGGQMLWSAFKTISRDYGMGGALPISVLHLEAWQRLYRIKLTPWELEIIRVFDGIVLDAAQKETEASKERRQ